MTIETELKLRITAAQLTKLKRHALLKSCTVSAPVTRRLHNIYYDTPQFALHKTAMALRLRHTGQQWLQTLKGGGSVQAGLHQRHEWEIPVRGPELDFSSLEQAEWNRYLPKKIRNKLHPVFVTDFSRTARILSWHGAEIELCMDRGVVSTEQHSSEICELELELKSGQPGQLFELALELLKIVPFELEVVSKAEQGYRLLSGHIEKPLKAAMPDFAKHSKLAEALQMLIWSCVQHFQANLRGAMSGVDAEYLHQIRVALRRLRVALRMANRVCPDAELNGLMKEVAGASAALGSIREWDVFVAQTVHPLCMQMPRHRGLQALRENGEQQRADCYTAFRSESRARELQGLMLRFAIWMNSAYWQQFEAISAPDFAGRYLDKLHQRFSHAEKQIQKFDAANLHALRILSKKLRYSAEFFSAWYDAKSSQKFLVALGHIQEVLGQINDIAVAHRLIDELTNRVELQGHEEALGLAKGWIAHDLSQQFVVLQKVMRRFDKQKKFWM